MDRRKIKIGVSILFVVLTVLSVNAQPLDSLLMMAVENNPELKALDFEYKAALEKKNQVNQLPNPEVGVGVPILRPETRLGPQIVMVGAKQMFPWFGTLKSKENVALAMAKVKYERVSALKLEIFHTIKTAYLALCLIDRKLRIVENNLEIYRSLERLTLSKVESGKTTIADVLRTQLKIQKFEQDLKLLENDKRTFYAKINALINQDLAKPIIVEDSYADLAVLSVDLEGYRVKIKEHHPLILQIDGKIETSKYTQEVNNNMGKPSFGVGLDYALVAKRIDMDPQNNGRDILIPKVMISIPLYRKKYAAKNKEEELNQQAYAFHKLNIENKMLGMIKNYIVQYDRVLLQIELTDQQTKTTQQTFEILLAQYSAVGSGFDDLLQLQNELIQYALEMENYTIQTYQIQVNIDRLTDF